MRELRETARVLAYATICLLAAAAPAILLHLATRGRPLP